MPSRTPHEEKAWAMAVESLQGRYWTSRDLLYTTVVSAIIGFVGGFAFNILIAHG
jgi:hypothetical protein